jgi:hypothetical protein
MQLLIMHVSLVLLRPDILFFFPIISTIKCPLSLRDRDRSHNGYENRLMVECMLKNYTVKGKAIPLQSWTGPEDSRRLRFPDFKTIGA